MCRYELYSAFGTSVEAYFSIVEVSGKRKYGVSFCVGIGCKQITVFYSS
jgi:hypothetical protein